MNSHHSDIISYCIYAHKLCCLPALDIDKIVIPGTRCQWFHQCDNGEPKSIVKCGDGMHYNPYGQFCDVQIEGKQEFVCPPDPTCPPTHSPTKYTYQPPVPSPPGEIFTGKFLCPHRLVVALQLPHTYQLGNNSNRKTNTKPGISPDYPPDEQANQHHPCRY